MFSFKFSNSFSDISMILGKISQPNQVAAACALAAVTQRRPVRIRNRFANLHLSIVLMSSLIPSTSKKISSSLGLDSRLAIEYMISKLLTYTFR